MSDRTLSYKDLLVWQRAIDLAGAVYELTRQLPREELYGLMSQIRRCAVSIPSNIAEGRNRGTRKDYLQFLRIAYGSGAELETQLVICKKIYQSQGLNYGKVEGLLNEVMRMLNVMIRKLQPQKANAASEAKS